MSTATLPGGTTLPSIVASANRKTTGRARVLTIGCVKGGVGKSTTAIMLALAYVMAYQIRILVVDADPKNSASWMWARRAHRLHAQGNAGSPLPFDVKSVAGRSFLEEKIQEEGWLDDYDMIIIDTGGEDDSIFMEAAAMADHILLTISPSAMDMDALPKTANAARRAVADSGDKAVDLLFTMCIANSREVREARRELASVGITAMAQTIPLHRWYRTQYGQLPVHDKRVSCRAYAAVQFELDNPRQEEGQ